MDRLHLHHALLQVLRLLQRPDGGFPASAAGGSEVEPTVVAALALRDPRAHAWLVDRQRPDGGFDEPDGRVAGPTTAALASLALDDAHAARRALGHAVAHRGLPPPDADDPERRTGWGWTDDVRSTVEPTSRVLVALKALTPGDAAVRGEALRLLRERRCADGGWNYGNASVNDVDLRGYAQTTAVALIGLQGETRELTGPAIAFLRRRWRLEPGGLTTAQALVAFRLHGVTDEVQPALDALARMADDRPFRENTVALAWAGLATGPDELLEPLTARA